MINGKNIIGQGESSNGSITFKTIDPKLNLENEWSFHEASEEEISMAVELAKNASTAFWRTSDEERANFLEQIANEIENLGDELIEAYIKETGLPRSRAEGERGRTMNQLKLFANFIRGDWKQKRIEKADPNRSPIPKPDLRKTMVPIGPVVVFGASNFPLAFSTAGGDTASALAAGCPVIVKSHPMHAGTGELVSRAIQKAATNCQMPEGVFSNLNGMGITVGQKLVSHPEIKGVGFTGSLNAGRALYDLAAKREEPIPVFAEMGSINPVIITSNALKTNGNKWAETYAGSITLGCGQFCTNPGLIVAQKGPELDEFISQLSGHLESQQTSNMLHPNIASSYEMNKNYLLESSEVELITAINANEANHASHSLATTTAKEFTANPNLHQEVFGPFSLIVSCTDQSEIIEVIQSLDGQLTATILAENTEGDFLPELAFALSQKVGRIIYNGVPTGVEVNSAMHHGGPYPATTDGRFTSVGTDAIYRWTRPLSYQNFPAELLPAELANE